MLALNLGILCLVIVIHEVGHLVAARVVGIHVHEFSAGLGPILCSRTWGSTRFCLRIIPLGGYVRVASDEDTLENDVPVEKSQTYEYAGFWQRQLFHLGGVIANILSGFVAIVLVATVAAVIQGQDSIVQYVLSKLWLGLYVVTQTLVALYTLNFGFSEISGPVGILSMDAPVHISASVWPYILFIVLSFGIATFNLLPMPVLDGGRIFLDVLQVVLRRRFSGEMKMAIMGVSAGLVLLFMLAITVQDIYKLF